MALGQTYNNNQQGKFQPSAFTRYKFSNANSKIDATALSTSYWNNLLKIAIAPIKPSQDDTIAFDYENSIGIHLSVTKAGIFRREIEKFMACYHTDQHYINCGVSTPKGCIYICDGSEFETDAICIVIKLLDELGNVKSSIAYEINKNYHFAIRDYKDTEKHMTKITKEYDTYEIDLLINLLKSYEDAMTCATAYSVLDVTHHIFDRMHDNIVAIGDKLGVNMKQRPIRMGSKGSNFFDSYGNDNAVGTDGSTSKVVSYGSYSDYDNID